MLSKLLVFSLLLLNVVFCDWMPRGPGPLDPNPGRTCLLGEKGEEPGIRYYKDLLGGTEGWPFWYWGCGGDSNRYRGRTFIYDIGGCPGGIWSASGRSCGQCRDDEVCGTGHYTQPCCDKKAVDAYFDAVAASTCPHNAYKVDGRVFYGRKCHHNFCPTNTVCYQGQLMASCCLK